MSMCTNFNLFFSEPADVPLGECKTLPGLESDCKDAPSPAHLLQFFESSSQAVPSNTLLYLVISAVSVLVFTLGLSFIEVRKHHQ